MSLSIIYEIENDFMEFNKYYKELTEFSRRLQNFTSKEYEKKKDDAHNKMQLIPNLLKLINKKYDQIYSRSIPQQLIEKLNKIRDIITPMVNHLPNLMNDIYEGEKIFSLKIKNINLNEKDLDDSISFLNNKSDNFKGSRIVLQEVIDNHIYLEKRKEELENIKVYVFLNNYLELPVNLRRLLT